MTPFDFGEWCKNFGEKCKPLHKYRIEGNKISMSNENLGWKEIDKWWK